MGEANNRDRRSVEEPKLNGMSTFRDLSGMYNN